MHIYVRMASARYTKNAKHLKAKSITRTDYIKKEMRMATASSLSHTDAPI